MVVPHIWPIRIYYEDTDCGGIVYHTGYLRFAERARTEMLRQMGIDQSVLLSEQGIAFAVREISVKYIKPARLDDELEVRTELKELSKTRITLVQNLYRDKTHLTEILVEIICITTDGKPLRLPEDIFSCV